MVDFCSGTTPQLLVHRRNFGTQNKQKDDTKKKNLQHPDNHDGVITHLETDILECKVKWALGSITMNKASGGDGIPVELFQILKDDAVKADNMPANLENSAVATGLEKVSFHFNPKEDNAKECSNYHTIPLISHASKVILKILQARLQQYVNHEIPDVQAGFRKGRGTRDQIATSWKKQESSRKTSTSVLLTLPYFDCVDHKKL